MGHFHCPADGGFGTVTVRSGAIFNDRDGLGIAAGQPKRQSPRNPGHLDEARALAGGDGIRWPELRALTVFLSLVELSGGNDRRAALLLLGDIAGDHGTDGSLLRYQRSLRSHAAHFEPDNE